MDDDQDEPLGVRIGLREIYDQVSGVLEHVRALRQESEAVTHTLDDHEGRIRELERDRPRSIVPVALITAIGTVIAAALAAFKLVG